MNRTRAQEILLVSAILCVATFLRVYRLAQLPPGLHYDEAFNATMAYRVWMGIDRPIFFTEDMTEEPLAIYITALAFALLGETAWTIRLVSALAGIATVAALYALARVMFRARVVAALAAFTLAIVYWHVNFSRLGMEPILTPLMLTLAFTFLWKGVASGEGRGARGVSRFTFHASRLTPHVSRFTSHVSRFTLHVSPLTFHVSRFTFHFALAGIFFAATLYTYKAALFVPILFAAFIGLDILLERKFWVENWRGLVLLVSVAILAFAPLGIYLATHPEQFFERPSSVAAFDVATIADHALKVAGMFFLRGDENPRSNLPGRPALDPFLALGFIVGIIACIARIRRREARLLLLWLGVMSAPSIVTDFAPHFGRNIAATPAIALIVAYGFAALLQTVKRRRTASRLLPTAYCLLLIGLTFSAFTTARDYFAIWGARTGAFYSFDVGYLALAQKMRDRPASETLYLSPVDAHHYTIQFGLARRAARSFDGRFALVLPPPNVAATYGIVTRDDSCTLARLCALFPDVRVVETVDDFTGNAYASLVRVEGAARVEPHKFVRAQLGDAIELIGYDRAREGESIVLTVYWRARAEPREDYTVFAHLVGAPGLVSQDDAQPARGSYPTSRWQRGEIIIDEYRLRVVGLPRGEYQIEIGMYNLHTGARVRVVNVDGVPMENDRVVFERITVP